MCLLLMEKHLWWMGGIEARICACAQHCTHTIKIFTFTPTFPPSPCYAKNLTGSLRKLKDTCIDFYNCAQKIHSAIANGLPVVKELAELLLKDVEADFTAEEQEITREDIQKLCSKLAKDETTMIAAVTRMKKITEQLESLSFLMVLEHKKTTSSILSTEEFVPMQTWPISKFCEEANYIMSMYHEEVAIKQEVISNICHQKTTDDIKLYVLLWIYQPEIRKCTPNLEALVLECGLKDF